MYMFIVNKISSIKSAVKWIYIQVRDGDVYDNWKFILLMNRFEVTSITTKESVIQWSLILFKIFASLRMLSAVLIPNTGFEYLLGRTLVNTSEGAGRLVSLTAGIIWMQSSLMRLTIWRSNQKHQMQMLPTIHAVQNGVQDINDDTGERKLRLARRLFYVLIGAIILAFAVVTAAFIPELELRRSNAHPTLAMEGIEPAAEEFALS